MRSRNLARAYVGIGHSVLMIVLFSYSFFALLSPAHASTLAEDFSSQTAFSPGSIVSIKKDNPKEVILTNKENSDYLLGVVSNNTNDTVQYVKSGSTVSVALNGETEVYVTDSNGVISIGDNIAVSSIQGIGMKMNRVASKDRLVGVALTEFDSSKSKEYTTSASNGGEKTFKVGSIRIRLYDKPTFAQDIIKAKKDGLVGVLSDFAGKDVSYARSMIALIVFILCIVVTGLFLGTSLYGSFISIGRNPLAAQSIFKSLSRVTLISIGIILIGAVLSYAVMVA